MTVQQWIVENLSAESLPRRAAAILLKITVEFGLFGTLTLIISYTAGPPIIDSIGGLPQIPNTWIALWLALFLTVMKYAWCFSAEKN